MIDVLDGWILMDRDILAIRYGPYRNPQTQQPQGWYVGVVLRGMDKMVTSPILRTEIEMHGVLNKLKAAWKAGTEKKEAAPPDTDLTERMNERLRETDRMLEAMRRENARKEAAEEKAAKSAKASAKTARKKKEESRFVPPTDEMIVDRIREKGFDVKLGQKAEDIAYNFRCLYEKEEDTGKKDDNGFDIRNIVWRKANGDLVKDWKGCLQTFVSRQLTWNGEKKTQGKGRTQNQFNQFAQNDYDFDELEDELAKAN